MIIGVESTQVHQQFGIAATDPEFRVRIIQKESLHMVSNQALIATGESPRTNMNGRGLWYRHRMGDELQRVI
jgi:hypothetical protein